MARRLIVEVVGDVSGFKKGMNESSALAGQFEGKIKGMSSSVRSHLMLMSGALIGVGSVAAGLKAVITVAEAAGQSTARLDRAIVNMHGSVKALVPVINAAQVSGRALGFTNQDTTDSLAKLVTAFGATRRAFNDLKIAQDFSAYSGKSLADSTQLIISTQEGNLKSAKALGIALPDLGKKVWEAKAAQDNLTIAQEKGKYAIEQLTIKVKGQAEALANTPTGKIDRFNAQLQNLEQQIGLVLIPTISKFLGKIADWMDKSENQRKITDAVKTAVAALTTAIRLAVPWIEKAWDAGKKLVDMLGGLKEALIAIAALKAAMMFSGVATQLGAIGANAKGAGGILEVLRGTLMKIAAIGTIALAFELIFNRSGLDNAVSSFLNKQGLPGGTNNLTSYKQYQALPAAIKSQIPASYVASLPGAPIVGTGNAQGVGSTAAGSPNRAGGFTQAQHYTQAQMAQLWIQAGGDPAYAQRMAKVGYAGESSGNVRATGAPNSNGTVDRGLWQINSSHGFGNTSYDPMQNAKQAVALFNSAQKSGTPLYKVWTDPVARQIFGSPYGPGAPPANQGGGGGGTKKAPAYKIPDALEAQIRAAQQKFTDGATQSHLDILDKLYKTEIKDLKAHGQDAKAQSVANEITKAGVTFQKVLAAAHLKIAQSTIAKIEAGSTGPAQVLALAQAAGEPVAVILADQNSLMGVYQAEATQLRAKLAVSTGMAKTAYKSALSKIQGSISSTVNSITSSLQSVAQTAQGSLQGVIGSIQTAADKALGSQYAQGGLQTPAEQQLAAMQSQDTAQGLSDTLTTAQAQLALDQKDVTVTAAQLVLDQKAIDAAQRAIDENDLAAQATRERATADAGYAKAQFNLDTQIQKLSATVGTGAGAQDALNKLLGGFGIALGGLTDVGGAGLLTQLQSAVTDTITAFTNLNDYMKNPAGGTSQATNVSLPGGISVPAGVIGHGFGGGFAAGGMGAVTRPTLFLAGEAGPEQFAFSGAGKSFSGGGGQPVVVNVYGWVGNDQQLAQKLRTEMLKIGRREGNIFGQFA